MGKTAGGLEAPPDRATLSGGAPAGKTRCRPIPVGLTSFRHGMPPINTILIATWGLWLVAAMVAIADPRVRKPFLLGIAVPGLGHMSIGEKGRGLLVAVPVLILYVAGLLLSDFRCVSPFDRHPLWGVLQAPAAGPTLLSWLGTRHLTLEHIGETYQVGCLYVGIACLLNLVALCDLRDLCMKVARRKDASA